MARVPETAVFGLNRAGRNVPQAGEGAGPCMGSVRGGCRRLPQVDLDGGGAAAAGAALDYVEDDSLFDA